MSDETITGNAQNEFSMFDPNYERPNYSLYTSPGIFTYPTIPPLPENANDGSDTPANTYTYTPGMNPYTSGTVPTFTSPQAPGMNPYTGGTTLPATSPYMGPYTGGTTLPATSPYMSPQTTSGTDTTATQAETPPTNARPFLGPYSEDWYAQHEAQASIPTMGAPLSPLFTPINYNNTYSLLKDDSPYDTIKKQEIEKVNAIVDSGWEDIDLTKNLEQFKDIFSVGNLDIFDIAEPIQEALTAAKEALEILAQDIADEYSRVSAAKERIMIERERQARLAEQNGSN